MVQTTKLSFMFVGSLLIVSVLFHIVLMRGAVPFEKGKRGQEPFLYRPRACRLGGKTPTIATAFSALFL
jgi:hypothetical protein